MTRTAEVIVVGAGIQGASLAFHLAGRGVDVLVLEKESEGLGSTARSSGFVRTHYDLPSEAALAWASVPYFEAWAEMVGAGDPSFVNSGFIQLVPAEVGAALRANVAMLQGIGVETEVIGPDEVASLVPGIVTDDIEVAAYEPRSGYADPIGAKRGLADAARARGARFERGRTVSAVSIDGDRVSGVETDRGHFAAPIVVNAAGPWAARLAASAGLDVPLKVWRHDTFYFDLPTGAAQRFPIVLDHAKQVYFRPAGGERVLVGLETANDMGGSPDRPFREIGEHDAAEARERVSARAPWMAAGTLHSAHGGQDGMTPDQRAIIDRVGPDGHYLLCGFSGSGFKTAPAIGLGMAELILDGVATSVDISPYTLGRFDRGELLIGVHPYPALWQ